MAVITLITDFGDRDEYVGVMKGVILSVNPEARIVDITHQVEPQDVVQAAYLICASYPYFPPQTVHVAVVDPGVGSSRAILAGRCKGHLFLGPDNGILSLISDDNPWEELVEVRNRDYFLSPISRTFHGRDIFAPVAARLAGGLDIHKLGPVFDPRKMKRLHIEKPQWSDSGELRGTVIAIDRFGNLLTDITEELIPRPGTEGDCRIEIRIGSTNISGLSACYDSVSQGIPLALIGSRGSLEISVNSGSARHYFGVEKGCKIRIKKENRNPPI
jgi:S-adenosylmethionine hydrolase